jgi:hypothetical protein
MFKKNHNNSLKHFAIVFWKQNINYMSHLTHHQTTQILKKFKLQTNLNELVLQPDFKKTKYTMCHKSCTKMCLIWLCKVQKQYKLRYYAKSRSRDQEVAEPRRGGGVASYIFGTWCGVDIHSLCTCLVHGLWYMLWYKLMHGIGLVHGMVHENIL